MRIRNLNTFIQVATLGSFHAAAIELNVSQPVVSARIAALEEGEEVILFKRDQSGIRITAHVTQLQPYAEKIVAISTEMKVQLRTNVHKKGILRIGIADTLAYLWFDVLLQKWR